MTPSAQPTAPTHWSKRLRISPRLRATLLLYHVAAVVVMSLPSGNIQSERWQSRGTQTDLEDWGRTAKRLGIADSTATLANQVQAVSAKYAKARRTLALPFEDYVSITGSLQMWNMFSSPQRHPSELHIDVREEGTFRPFYRAGGEPADPGLATLLKHDRLRKFQGRFARGFRPDNYEKFVAYLARRIFAQHPTVDGISVSLWSYRSPPPDAPPAAIPKGIREHERIYFRRDFEP